MCIILEMNKIYTFDWNQIQSDYDKGLTWDGLIKKYNLTIYLLNKAKAAGLFKSRSKGDSLRLSNRLKPRRKLSNETKQKISQSRKAYLAANPDKVPYKLNHYSKGDSYPETYFTECFKETQIIKKYRVLNYELDFCDPIRQIDIEIDGDQHFLDPNMVEHDKKRNQNLIELGWDIVRIKWSKFQTKSPEEKRQIVQNIISYNFNDFPDVVLFINKSPNPEKIKLYFKQQEQKKNQNNCECGKPKHYQSIKCAECNAYKNRKFNRPNKEELQKIIWEKPIRQIMKELGIKSFSTIKKWCKAYNIPMPPQGYWQRRQAGHSHDDSINPKSKMKSKQPNNKLTLKQVLEIKQLLLDGELTQREISLLYNIHNSTVSNIRTGKIHKNINIEISVVTED